MDSTNITHLHPSVATDRKYDLGDLTRIWPKTLIHSYGVGFIISKGSMPMNDNNNQDAKLSLKGQ